jgi:hypothetical protein
VARARTRARARASSDARSKGSHQFASGVQAERGNYYYLFKLVEVSPTRFYSTRYKNSCLRFAQGEGRQYKEQAARTREGKKTCAAYRPVSRLSRESAHSFVLARRRTGARQASRHPG